MGFWDLASYDVDVRTHAEHQCIFYGRRVAQNKRGKLGFFYIQVRSITSLQFSLEQFSSVLASHAVCIIINCLIKTF